MRYKTNYTVNGNELFYNDRLIDQYESHGHALAVLNLIEAAYNEGIEGARKAYTSYPIPTVEATVDFSSEERRILKRLAQSFTTYFSEKTPAQIKAGL